MFSIDFMMNSNFISIAQHNQIVQDLQAEMAVMRAEIEKQRTELENQKARTQKAEQESKLKQESVNYFLKLYTDEQCLKIAAESKNKETLAWAVFDPDTREDVYSYKNLEQFGNEKRVVDKYFCDLKNSQYRAMAELDLRLSSKVLALENQIDDLRRSNEHILENFKVSVQKNVNDLEARISLMEKSLLGTKFQNYIQKYICSGDLSKRKSALDFYDVRLETNYNKRLPDIRALLKTISETVCALEIEHPFKFGNDPHYFKDLEENMLPLFPFL